MEVENCDEKSAEYTQAKPQVKTFDLVIVGTGLAGLTVAYEANKALFGHKNILILEKMPGVGGNSKKATSGINILMSPIQEKVGLKDSESLFFEDTMRSGKQQNDPTLVSTLIEDSPSIYEFFKEEIGIELPNLSSLGGHSVARTHRPEKTPIGAYLIGKMLEKLKEAPSVQIICNATVNELLTDQDQTKILGLTYKLNGAEQSRFIPTKAVVLATGGFGSDFYSDDSLLREYAKDKAKFPTTNGPQTQGMGLKMAKKLGIKLVDMEKIQLHPTGFVNPSDRYSKHKILAPELFRAVGGVLVNQKGQRFCNELGTRDYVVEMIIKNCKKAKSSLVDQYEAFLLLDQEGIDSYGPNSNFYLEKGFLRKYETLYEFADKNNLLDEYFFLFDTLIAFKESCLTQKDEFGRSVFPKSFSVEGPFYGGIITPCIHYCMGGVSMNKEGELIKVDGDVMRGLYGAGEVTGGVHGGNRLGGNSLMECVVFGRRVAKSAAKYIQTNFD